ncbi:MAG: nucleotidyltransferase substrate binding protein [Nitrospinae bacterium]|nr:nucleotidyltransferase substrate binding protein [Nitrospinota bacterium]
MAFDKPRFVEKRSDFIKAAARLGEALSEPESPMIRDAAIQRFESTYELAWKAMKLWLENLDIDARNPRDTLREALKQGLIDDGNGWSGLHETRNLTSHTYDEEMARRVYSFIKDHATGLFETLVKKLESLG